MKIKWILLVVFSFVTSFSYAESQIIKGVGLSPQGFPITYNKFGDFLQEVSSFPNSAVLQVGSWRDDNKNGSDSGQIPKGAEAVAKMAKNYQYTPIIIVNWSSETTAFLNTPKNPTNNWMNQDARKLFQQMVVNFVSTYQPKYIFLGNETDFYAAAHPLDYAVWIKVYAEIYDEIKKVSPQTMVGTVFNFEHLTGTGKLNGWTKGVWGAINAHDLSKIDIIGITTYPWFNYARPDQIPDNYFNPLLLKIGQKPIAILETGWPANNHPDLKPLWEASNEYQVSYIQKLPSLIKDKNVKIINWLHLYPMQMSGGGNDLEWKLFYTVSLYDDNGNPRPAYQAWKEWQP